MNRSKVFKVLRGVWFVFMLAIIAAIINTGQYLYQHQLITVSGTFLIQLSIVHILSGFLPFAWYCREVDRTYGGRAKTLVALLLIGYLGFWAVIATEGDAYCKRMSKA